MEQQEFVETVKIVVGDSAIHNTISRLIDYTAGSKDRDMAGLAAWYEKLPIEGRECVKQIIGQAVSTTLFGFFCVLDGVRSIDYPPDKGTLELRYSNEKVDVLLNDFSKEELHDIYNDIR